MSKDRLEAFMDAVLAIIMTILVLGLPKPDPMTVSGVLALKDTYVCYILSFFWLGTMWVNLHNEWHQIQIINRRVVWLGVVLLFVTSWIPYSMSVVTDDPSNRLAQFLYGVSVMLVTIVNMLLSLALYRCHVDIETCDSKMHAWVMRVRYIPDFCIKLIGMYLTVYVYPQAMVYSVLVAMVWSLLPVERLYHKKNQ